MVRFRHSCLATLLCGLLSVGIGFTPWGEVGAVEVADLYEAEVPVATRDPADRREALQVALTQVLRKVSGERNPDHSKQLLKALSAARRYVQQFRYRSVDLDPVAGAGEAEQQVLLRVQFDPTAVNALLDNAGLPVWSRVRPALLVWLGVEAGGQRNILGADSEGPLAGSLLAVAAQRGAPLMYPLLDMEDRRGVRVSDVWGGFRDNILSASARYGSEAVLVGRVYQVLPTLWEANWRLFVDSQASQWSTRADLAEAVAEEGVHEAVDRLAALFTRSETGLQLAGTELVVEGVRTLHDYARALNYLRSLDLVTELEVRGVQADRVAFGISARGGDQALQQVIALGRVLEPVAQPGSMEFRLQP